MCICVHTKHTQHKYTTHTSLHRQTHVVCHLPTQPVEKVDVASNIEIEELKVIQTLRELYTKKHNNK